MLREHPETDLIFAHNDRMALGAYQVCKQLGLDRRIRVMGVDGLPGNQGGIQLVQDGVLTATLLYPPGRRGGHPDGHEDSAPAALRQGKHARHDGYRLDQRADHEAADREADQPAAGHSAAAGAAAAGSAPPTPASRRCSTSLAAALLGVAGLGLLAWSGPSGPTAAATTAWACRTGNQLAAQPAAGACRAGQGRNRGQAALLHQLLPRAAHPAHPDSGAGGGNADGRPRPARRPPPRPEPGAPQRPAPAAAREPAHGFPQD